LRAACSRWHVRFVLLGELATVPRAAVVVEDRWADVFRLQHVFTRDGGRAPRRRAGALPERADRVRETRKLAEEWAYRFLGAALRYADEEADINTETPGAVRRRGS
jgi:hypothetical protein